MATPVGNPQNLFLYNRFALSPADFFRTMLPLAAAAAYAFCFLVVRPLVMLVFSDVCKPLIARLRQAG